MMLPVDMWLAHGCTMLQTYLELVWIKATMTNELFLFLGRMRRGYAEVQRLKGGLRNACAI